jgi:hypothetical protein
MYHVAAFGSSLAASTLEQVDAITEQQLTIANDRFLLQQDWNLVFAAALGTDLQRARLNQPSMRSVSLPWIRPINDGDDIPTDPGVADYRRNPFRLKGQESLSVDAFQDNASAQWAYVIAGLQSVNTPAPVGDTFTIRGTGSTTLTADVWNTVPITWDDNLEGGYYAIVGGTAISATGIAFRVALQGQWIRPGGLCVGDVSERSHPMFSNGGLGKWGEFESDALPNIEILASAADTAQEVYLDIIKIR